MLAKSGLEKPGRMEEGGNSDKGVCFPVSFANFFRLAILKNTSGRLLLGIGSYPDESGDLENYLIIKLVETKPRHCLLSIMTRDYVVLKDLIFLLLLIRGA